MKFKRTLCFFLNLNLILSLIFVLPLPSFAQVKEADKIYKVAILPFLIHSQENLDYLRQGIYDILSSRITAEGRIIVIERSVVERALVEERPTRLDETVAKSIGTRVGADYIIFGSLTKIGDYISLDASLISITEDKPPLGAYTQHKGIDDVMLKIGEFAQDIGNKILGRRATARKPGEPGSPALVKPRREIGSRLDPEGVKKSQTLPFEIKGLDVGDVDGDKKNEVVIMDKNNLYVFKFDGEKLSLLLKVELGSEHNFLTLDAADVNRNGTAEIIVTSIVEDNLRSFILEHEDGKLKKITEKAGWCFRVLEHPKEGPILIGQQMGSEGLIAGTIYRFVWKKKSFERGPKMDFPKQAKIFGLAIADLRSQGKPDVVMLDDLERLWIVSTDGKFEWRSRARYGGTAAYYETLKKKEDAFRPQDALPYRVYVPGRILIRDLDGDGIPEVVINRNEFSTGEFFQRARSFDMGEVYDLVWDENTLSANWKTREIRGYVADYQVKDADNNGEVELVVAAVESGGSKSNIIFLKLF